MKKYCNLISVILLVCLIAACFAGCSPSTGNDASGTPDSTGAGLTNIIDYAGSVTLDMSSASLKQEVTVKTYVDGDTTHFDVPESVISGGVLKARYLAINTPESTGKIEEWGKKASNFTREKLSSATSIIIESDDGNWNADSTGSRYLVWVWYKPPGSEDYRNLNIEILQEGLAIASNSGQNRYGSTCLAAIDQAKARKLNVHSGEKDPDFYYGGAQEIDLKELRTNTEAYSNQKVAFNGIVTMNNNNGIYVEAYDEETEMYYGMFVYYGFNLPGAGLEIIAVGNEVRIVGSVQYYEAGGTWQVSDLSYRQMKPDDPNNLQLISSGHTGAYKLTDPKAFTSAKVTIETEDGSDTYDYAQLALGTTLEMKNLKVTDIYTTRNEDSSSYGAMTLTCQIDGVTVSVRTVVLYDDNGSMITESAYSGRTVDVKGIVDYYDGTYQIKVFSKNDITIH